jgi:hypothetical protein
MPGGLNANLLELGPANVYIYALPYATLETDFGDPDQDLLFRAKRAGAAGNQITIKINAPAGSGDIEISVDGTDIVISPPAGATAAEVRDAIAADPSARRLVVVSLVGDGSGVVEALAESNLSGGSDTGVPTNVGFLDVGLLVTIATNAIVLTGAQTGDIPQGKVISGGSFRVAIPFKEISLENLQRGIPNSILVTDSDGDRMRVEFVSQVGQSMRELAVKMEIRKIFGGAESTDPKDILVIPEISPVDGEVALPFHPTEQRVITANFEAWPNAQGMWAYFGDSPEDL